MSVTAELADGRVLEFPDGTDHAVVQATVKKMLAPKPPAPSMSERIVAAGIRGLPSGPLGLATQVSTEATKIGSELLDKTAYRAGGAVTDLTGSPAAGLAANVAVQTVPMLLGGALTKAVAPPTLLRSGAETLMKSALKPTVAMQERGIGDRAVKTMLDEGLNATSGGVQKLKDRIGTLNQEISEAIANSSASVDKNAVVRALDSVYQKFRNQVNPQSDIAAIDAARDAFINHPALQGAKHIPVQLAQDIKTGTYRVLRDKYGLLGSADTEAQKSLARGLKEQIAAAVPEVVGRNARETRLLDALKVAERRMMVEGNKNPISLGALADNPLGFIAWMADRSAAAKSLLARAINARQQEIPAIPGYGLGALIGAQSGAPPASPLPDSGLYELLKRQQQ